MRTGLAQIFMNFFNLKSQALLLAGVVKEPAFTNDLELMLD